jgi:hypothetical protein
MARVDLGESEVLVAGGLIPLSRRPAMMLKIEG